MDKADQFLARHKIGTKKTQGMPNNVYMKLCQLAFQFLVKTDQQEGISLEI